MYIFASNSLDDTLFNVNICILHTISIDNFSILDEKSILSTLRKQKLFVRVLANFLKKQIMFHEIRWNHIFKMGHPWRVLNYYIDRGAGWLGSTGEVELIK